MADNETATEVAATPVGAPPQREPVSVATDLASAKAPADVAAVLRAAYAHLTPLAHEEGADPRWTKTLAVLGEAAKSIEKTVAGGR